MIDVIASLSTANISHNLLLRNIKYQYIFRFSCAIYLAKTDTALICLEPMILMDDTNDIDDNQDSSDELAYQTAKVSGL